MLRPNYFVIGAAKAASSTVCTLLGMHPEVFMVECKEPCFFNDDGNYLGRGWVWYESLYAGSERCARRGEGTNNYTMKEIWPKTAGRIADAAPDAKLIYVVRHPLRRIESWWMQKMANGDGKVHPDFNRAVVERSDIFVDSSDYQSQLEPYRRRFREDQIKIVFFEDFQADQDRVIKQLFEYLEVDPDDWIGRDQLHLNPSEGKLVFTPTLMKLRRAKWLGPAKKLVPDDWKQWGAEAFFRRPMTAKPRWESEVKHFVMERLRPNSERLCVECGKRPDFWSWDEA